MKLHIWTLRFFLDFSDTTKAYAKKIGIKETAQADLEIAEDTIEFNDIVGQDWKSPEAVIITIDGIPWIIPFSDF